MSDWNASIEMMLKLQEKDVKKPYQLFFTT